MKLFSISVGILHLANLGLGAPFNHAEGSLHALSQHEEIPQSQSLDIRSPNEAHDALSRLETRAPRCVNRAIQIFNLNDSTAVLSYINLAGMSAHYICEHYHDSECAWWAKFITVGINAIFAIARKGSRTEGAVGESPDNSVSSFARSLPTKNYAEILTQAFADFGLQHNGIEDVDISSLYHAKRDTTEPDLTHRLIVRGIKAADNFTHDIAFNQYSNGGHILHLGGLNESLQTNPSLETTKRASFGQEGVKISAFVEAPPKLSVPDSNKASTAIGKDWAQRAGYNDISEYIGYVQGGSKINFIYRIIPEVQGFGLNYEDVSVCGAFGPPKS